jgi:hypothetical protein
MSAKFISALRGYIRLTKSPLDASSIHGSYDDALNYVLTDPTAYAGQFLSVVDDNRKVTSYVVSEDAGKLKLNELLQGDSEQFQQLHALLQEFSEVFDHFSFNNGKVIIDNPVEVERLSVNTDLISEDDDVITVGYLDRKVNSLPKNVEILSFIMDNSGGSTKRFDKTIFLDKITVVVEESYSSPLSIYFENELLVHSDDIHEVIYDGENSVTTILEINKQISQPGVLRIETDSPSATGKGYFTIIFKE